MNYSLSFLQYETVCNNYDVGNNNGAEKGSVNNDGFQDGDEEKCMVIDSGQ